MSTRTSAGYLTVNEFNTCPPKRVLLIGDSVALTMGIEMVLHEKDWGTLIDDKALTGCGFIVGDDVDPHGVFTPMASQCNNEDAQWAADARTAQAQAIVVEMGWWDSEPHMISGSVATLTQPGYDTMVEQDILGLITRLRSASSAPIFFLSVPWMDPPAWTNGQQDPAASAAYHNEINDLIESAVRTSSSLHFIDVSPYLTPSGQFQAVVDGQVCRETDGVHLYYRLPTQLSYVYTRCGAALSNGVLSTVREVLARARTSH